MSWKIPVAYYLTHTGINSLDLANLIVKIIKKLWKVNTKDKIRVCDQESNNTNTCWTLDVTIQEPFFTIDTQK